MLSTLPTSRQKDLQAGKPSIAKANEAELNEYKEILEKETA